MLLGLFFYLRLILGIDSNLFQTVDGNTSVKYAVLALREVWESETPKNRPGTSKNQCQEVWDS